MALDRPIFIVASGRAGSTIYHRILCEHPSLAWLTDGADRAPSKPERANRLMRAADLPGVGGIVRKIYPSECYDFWEHLCPGFRRPCRDLVAGDASSRSITRVRAALEAVPTSRRNRLSIKITGWPRLGLLHAIFPDALFIHLLRDGRSVANSFLNVPWWLGWRGPSNWRWGELSNAHAKEWEKHGRSFVALAGIQWKIFVEAMEAAKAKIPAEQFLELRYEDLCSNPKDVFAKTLDFCGLESSATFSKKLEGFSLSAKDDKWRLHLSEEQQSVLEEVLRPSLERTGYLEENA